MREIDVGGHDVAERAHGLDLGLHGEQHAPHVRMVDDGDALAALRAQRAALNAFPGVFARLLVGALGDAQTLQADLLAGFVHHGEHVREPLVLPPHQIADRTILVAEAHDAGGARVDAQLVLDRHAVHVVAGSEGSVGVDQELGHQEQRDAARAFGRVRQTGQHEVDDVPGHVVVAPGDEDLLTVNAVMVALGQRLGAHRREVRAGLRLGQVHRPGPLAADELGQIARLLLGRAVRVDRLHRARRQQRAQRERHVGGVPHLHGRGHHHPGQALAAVLGIAAQSVPAALDELAVGRAETVGRHDTVLAQARALPVAGLVQGRQHFGGELRSLLEDGVHQLGRGFLEPRQRGVLLQAGQLVHHEVHIACGRKIGAHRAPPPVRLARSRPAPSCGVPSESFCPCRPQRDSRLPIISQGPAGGAVQS